MITKLESWHRSSLVMGAIATAIALLNAGTVLGQSSLQITAPSDGTLVNPGQTISVVVTPGPGASFPSGIGILADVPLGGAGPTLVPPFSFSLAIPTKISPGRYEITAVGRDASDHLVMSVPVGIQVEASLPVTKLQVQSGRMTLHSLGQQLPILVSASFSDGTTSDVTASRNTAYSSNNPAVATVDTNGIVTAVSTGSTEVIVRYSPQSVDIAVSVVTGPAVTISASPSTLWPPNGQMVPVNISGIIQSAGGGIRPGSGRYQVTDEYGTVLPKGTVTLALDGSYSFTVLLEASRHGDDLDGRQYTILVTAKDNGGIPGSASTVVVVPHDQGH